MRATLHLTSRLLTEGCEPELIESRAVGILRADGDGYTLRYTEKTEGRKVFYGFDSALRALGGKSDYNVNNCRDTVLAELFYSRIKGV